MDQSENNCFDELMNELGVHRPAYSIENRLYGMNLDMEFLDSYFAETHGPTHRFYKLNVLNTWRLRDIPPGHYRVDLRPHLFLMMGVPKDKLYATLARGVQKTASSRAVFGERGYYLTSCSSKAANQGLSKNQGYEKRSDRGNYQPGKNIVLYILLCEFARGNGVYTVSRNKDGLGRTPNRNSIIHGGRYAPSEVQISSAKLSEKEYEVYTPRGPLFRNTSVQKCGQDYFDYDEFYVENLEQIHPVILARVCADR